MEMFKRRLGNILVVLGSPAMFSAVVTQTAIKPLGLHSIHLLWSLPFATMTWPLLPAYIIGVRLLKSCDFDDFKSATNDLPRVHTPVEYASIFFESGAYYIEPFCWQDGADKEEPFSSREEACNFLLSLGYHEVIDTDKCAPPYSNTIWIKEQLNA